MQWASADSECRSHRATIDFTIYYIRPASWQSVFSIQSLAAAVSAASIRRDRWDKGWLLGDADRLVSGALWL